MNSNLKSLHRDLIATFGRERVRENEPLARHCNWRVGGPADIFLTVRSADELVRTLRLSHQHSQKPTIIGFGANSLVSDKGIRGLVILNRAHRIVFLPDFLVEADSGTNLVILAKETAANGVGGFEFLIGIPGTVGAAVTVNAGTRTLWISSLAEQIRVFKNNGEDVWLPPAELDFSYRHSTLKDSGEIVLTARLRGHPEDPGRIEQTMADFLQQRKNQPSGPSAGSVFKNPAGDFAGRLIEACGLKGFQIGGAKVSEMHANFILNIGGATAQNIKNIIARIKTEVKARFKIELEEEIRYLGEW
jgi:UDP-N-acetylmuramate dehydrogenase